MVILGRGVGSYERGIHVQGNPLTRIDNPKEESLATPDPNPAVHSRWPGWYSCTGLSLSVPLDAYPHRAEELYPIRVPRSSETTPSPRTVIVP
jgi:hypothetical protein